MEARGQCGGMGGGARGQCGGHGGGAKVSEGGAGREGSSGALSP